MEWSQAHFIEKVFSLRFLFHFFKSFSLTLPPSNSLTHSISISYSVSLSLSPSILLYLFFSISYSLTHFNSSLTPSSLFPSLSIFLLNSLFLTPLSHTHSLTHSFFPSLSLSLSFSLLLTPSLTLFEQCVCALKKELLVGREREREKERIAKNDKRKCDVSNV